MFAPFLAMVFFTALATPNKRPAPEVIGSQTEYYHSALRAFREDRWDDGILMMEYFVNRFPKSDLADNALFWIAQAYIQKNELALAKNELERLIKQYPRSDRAARAQVRLQIIEESTIDIQKTRTPHNDK